MNVKMYYPWFVNRMECQIATSIRPLLVVVIAAAAFSQFVLGHAPTVNLLVQQLLQQQLLQQQLHVRKK